MCYTAQKTFFPHTETVWGSDVLSGTEDDFFDFGSILTGQQPNTTVCPWPTAALLPECLTAVQGELWQLARTGWRVLGAGGGST